MTLGERLMHEKVNFDLASHIKIQPQDVEIEILTHDNSSNLECKIDDHKSR